MGVVIQEMAEPDAAGVMFSRNPVTGNPSEIVITANFGLGEVRIFISLFHRFHISKYFVSRVSSLPPPIRTQSQFTKMSSIRD